MSGRGTEGGGWGGGTADGLLKMLPRGAKALIQRVESACIEVGTQTKQ